MSDPALYAAQVVRLCVVAVVVIIANAWWGI